MKLNFFLYINGFKKYTFCTIYIFVYILFFSGVARTSASNARIQVTKIEPNKFKKKKIQIQSTITTICMDFRFDHNDYSVLLCASGTVSHISEAQLWEMRTEKTICLHRNVCSVIDSFTIIRPTVKFIYSTFLPTRKFSSNWTICLQ